MTREELKTMLPSAWFDEPNEVVLDSFDEFCKDVIERGVEPTNEYFTMLVNANIEAHYTCSYQSNCWY
jgi:hypothetical protein|nr:MAG TPA: hypothetical protein [Caudoviricetes sp.]